MGYVGFLALEVKEAHLIPPIVFFLRLIPPIVYVYID